MFPLPPQAVFLPDETKSMIKVLKDNGVMGDFPVLRIHVFALNESATNVEIYYAEQLPEFELFEFTQDKKARVATYGQFLKVWGGDMYTANSIEDIPQDPGEGILLDITSIYRKKGTTDPQWVSELFKLSPTLSERKAFCKIVYVNYR